MFLRITILLSSTRNVTIFHSDIHSLNHDNNLSFLSDGELNALMYDIDIAHPLSLEKGITLWYRDYTFAINVKRLDVTREFVLDHNGTTTACISINGITIKSYDLADFTDASDYFDVINTLGVRRNLPIFL